MVNKQRSRYALTLLIYLALYLLCFYYLEKTVTNYNIIHLKIDDYIPFCEFFIVPYLLWFPFLIIATLYFYIKCRPGFTNLVAFFMIGTTVFLIVSFIYPNGQDLRPLIFERDNVFVDLVKYLYSTDTPANILPSVHVLNTLGVQIAILTDDELKKKKWVTASSVTLSVLIIMSTVLLKQHSVLDVISAVVLSIAMYMLLYKDERTTLISRKHKKLFGETGK